MVPVKCSYVGCFLGKRVPRMMFGGERGTFDSGKMVESL